MFRLVHGATALSAAALVAVSSAPAAHADNSRLNNGVVANVYTVQHQAGCTTDIKKNPALTRVETVNGMDPEAARNRPRFDDLTPILPDDELALARESTDGDRTGALIDAIAPIGKGQRALVAAPPRSGRTEVLKQIATSIEANHPDVQLIVLLIDERPEDVTELDRKSVV